MQYNLHVNDRSKSFNLGSELRISTPPPIYPFPPKHPKELQSLPHSFTPPGHNYPAGGNPDGKIANIKAELGQVTMVMHGNLQRVLERGDTLQSLNVRSGTHPFQV